MASVGVIAASSALGPVGSFFAGIAAAYFDSAVLFPKMFPVDDEVPDRVSGVSLSTGANGSPRVRAYGQYALVPGHVLFIVNILDVATSSGGKGKQPGVSTGNRVTADVGYAWCDNAVQQVEVIYADQDAFWQYRRQLIVLADYRFAPSVSGSNLRLTATDLAVQDPTTVLVVDRVAVVGGLYPLSVNDRMWRVAAVVAHAPGVPGRVDLFPIEGQSTTVSVSGDPADPVTFTLLYNIQVQLSAEWAVTTNPLGTPGNSNLVTLTMPAATLGPLLPPNSFRVGDVLVTRNLSPAEFNGRWSLQLMTTNLSGAHVLRLQNLEGRSWGTGVAVTLPTGTNPAMIFAEESDPNRKFVVPVAGQEYLEYRGNQTDGPDPTLSVVHGSANVHGYRGLTRSTVEGMLLTNFGDRVPDCEALVRVSSNDTYGSAMRRILLEAGLTEEEFDATDLVDERLLGYAVLGPQQTAAVLGKLMLASGIETQDRVGVICAFRPAQADVHQLAEDEFGAYVGDERPKNSFDHRHAPDSKLPKRTSLSYQDPTLEWVTEVKSTGERSPESLSNSQDHVQLSVDPVVLWPWDAQSRVEHIHRETVVARDQGTLVLPPSRIDVLENDRLTFTAHQRQHENVVPTSGEIHHVAEMTAIENGSIELEVVFAGAGPMRLTDDFSGSIGGYPPSLTVTVRTVNYATGAIDFVCTNDDVVEARLYYDCADSSWTMRAQKVVVHANRMVTCELVAVPLTYGVLGSPITYNGVLGPYPYPSGPAPVATQVLEVPALGLGFADSPGIFFAAGPPELDSWRGAVVYESRDGGANYDAIGMIQGPSVVGSALTALPTASTSVWDYKSTLTVQLSSGGSFANATEDEVYGGANRLLVGSEVVAFRTAVDNGAGSWTLSGFLRGRRGTEDHVLGHAIGDAVVLLTGIGESHGLFHPWGSYADAGQSRSFKVVPVGAALSDVDAVAHVVQAENVRPFSPVDEVDVGYEPDTDQPWKDGDIVVRWRRRTRFPVSFMAHGMTPPLGEAYEQYRVEVRKNSAAVRTVDLGGPSTGSVFVHRVFRYTAAEIAADSYSPGDSLEIFVRQVGTAGIETGASPFSLIYKWVF